jgi:hypothetical protein
MTDLRKAVEMAVPLLIGYREYSGDHRIANRCGEVLEALRQALAQPEQESEAYRYAKRLAKFIWAKHYKKKSPDWTPLPDVLGVLTQIDNMTCGLELAKPEQTETLRVADAIELNVATKVERLFAANELRRLHDENETLKKCLFQMQNAAIELAKPEQEPVNNNYVDIHCPSCLHSFAIAPLRKEWVGLTDDEMLKTLIEIDSKTVRLPIGFKLFARAIEAKLKEKNT